MLAVYLRFLGILILMIGIFNALWYSSGVQVASGVICAIVLFDVYVAELIEKLKGK